MTNIKAILSTLDEQLQQLVASYEKQIEELKAENHRLLAEVDSLLSEKQHLQELLSVKERENKARTDMVLNQSGSHGFIDDLFLSQNIKDTISLLEYCNFSVKERNWEKVHYILELFTNNLDPLIRAEQQTKEMLVSLLKNLIDEVPADYQPSIEKTMETTFELLTMLNGTHLKDDLKGYFKDQFTDLLEMTVNFNEPKIIMAFLRLFMTYKLYSELKESLSYIINTEWEFIDSHLTKEQFFFYLWYAYLFDLDQLLIDKTKDSLKWLEDKQVEGRLYTFLYDCLNGEKMKDEQEFGRLIEGFRHGEILTELEVNQILDKVENALAPIRQATTSDPFYMGKLYMVKETELSNLIKWYNLKKQERKVPLFKSKGVNIPAKYIPLTIFYKNKKKAFIASELVESVHKHYYPKVLNISKYDVVEQKPAKEKTSREQPTSEIFPWPNTEIQENENSGTQERPVLNENSELRKLGYQITGMTRAKRWSVLEKAVPTLGLKTIAYIIANHVRMRKGQKNGRVKFQHAIAEWEYDLDKLKKHFYKKNFTWPSY